MNTTLHNDDAMGCAGKDTLGTYHKLKAEYEADPHKARLKAISWETVLESIQGCGTFSQRTAAATLLKPVRQFLADTASST